MLFEAIDGLVGSMQNHYLAFETIGGCVLCILNIKISCGTNNGIVTDIPNHYLTYGTFHGFA